jgi:LmbE family N-acetylglucosaminyl deacetylase
MQGQNGDDGEQASRTQHAVACRSEKSAMIQTSRRGRTLLLVALVSSVSLHVAAAHPRAVRQPSPWSLFLRSDARVLWIGAHPDDETIIAPLLGATCVENRVHCSLIVFTAGEAGACGLPSGCTPDLGEVRRGEMAAAASALHARLTQLDYPDVMDNVRAAWAAHDGNDAALLQRLRDLITAEQPTLIVTFDPAHGSTCHPAHRTLGTLVLEACAGESRCPPLYLVETSVTFAGDDISFAPAVQDAPNMLLFDVSAFWHYMTEDMALHASQFTSAQISSVSQTPSAGRLFPLLPATAAAAAHYTRSCP